MKFSNLFSCKKKLNAQNFLMNDYYKEWMNLILPFQNQVMDIMKKGKVTKENQYTQQIPKSKFQ
jgi:hypothetical protein